MSEKAPVEPYGIFGTQVAYQRGRLISDEQGNWYRVTEPSIYCAEIQRYNTPAQRVNPAPAQDLEEQERYVKSSKPHRNHDG